MTISRYLRLNRFVNIMFSEDMLEYQKIVIVQIRKCYMDSRCFYKKSLSDFNVI